MLVLVVLLVLLGQLVYLNRDGVEANRKVSIFMLVHIFVVAAAAAATL